MFKKGVDQVKLSFVLIPAKKNLSPALIIRRNTGY